MPTFRELINQRYPELEITHVHHAGNSSGVVDGAAAVLYAASDYARANGLKPRARISRAANMGARPDDHAHRARARRPKILAQGGHDTRRHRPLGDQRGVRRRVQKAMRDLDLDRDKVNVNGGAMALGHPIGATGAMLIGTGSTNSNVKTRPRLVTMCAGGGMAPATIIERGQRFRRSTSRFAALPAGQYARPTTKGPSNDNIQRHQSEANRRSAARLLTGLAPIRAVPPSPGVPTFKLFEYLAEIHASPTVMSRTTFGLAVATALFAVAGSSSGGRHATSPTARTTMPLPVSASVGCPS